MADSIKGVAVYLNPGMKVTLKAPVNGPNSQGFFVRQEELPDQFWNDYPKAGDLTRGFVVENTQVGTIEPTNEPEAAVTYWHKQPYPNAIHFLHRLANAVW